MKHKVLLLSVDGGGVRGKIASAFLELLEKDLNISLYDKFDFYAGTSTGALIILGITANKYTSIQINELYNKVNLQQIFTKSFWGAFPIHFGAKYKGEGKQKYLETLFGQKRFLDIVKPTVITAYDFINDKAIVFKSKGGSDSQYNPLISEVANASTAAPTYFPTVITSEAKPRNLIDGGIAANNPAVCLISEAIHNGYSLESIRLLSIGTGYHSIKTKLDLKSKNWGPISWFKNGIIDDFMLGDSSLEQYHCSTLLGNNYLRIDGSLEDASVDLDDISSTNLLKLDKLGQQWYQLNKKRILTLLN